MTADPLWDLLQRSREDRRPFLRLLDRRWSRAELLQEAEQAAGGLAALAGPGAVLGLLLPNLPAAVVALLAGWRGGLAVAPMDPRQGPARLEDWVHRLRPRLLVTLDLATVWERAARVAGPEVERILVMRMADQLGPLKRILAPWLRGGGVVRPDGDPRALSWRALPAAPPPAASRPLLVLPDGGRMDPADALGLIAPVPPRALLVRPLAERAALAALLSAWAGGGELVLTPRLDERALTKIGKAVGPLPHLPSGEAEGRLN